MTDAAIDDDELALFAFKVWSIRQGQVVANMVHIGDRLGLYRTMWGAGPMTAADLAAATGLHERWLKEWLRGQAAADLVDSEDGETFEMSALQAEVLANESESLFFAAGAFGEPPDAAFMDKLVDAFRTGRGMPYDALGAGGADQTERMLGPFTRQMLVPVLIAGIDGLTDKLRSGVRVADVGCGGGLAISVLAAAFPESTIVGIDPSRHAIDRAERKVTEQGLTNVEVFCADGTTVSDHGEFDVVLTFDCLHDMPRPDLVAEAISTALTSDGTWLVKEIRCSGDFATDRKNPVLAMMYAGSVMSCMSSALSEPDGLGLGTLGLPPDRLRAMAEAVGFSGFETHDIGDPANLYYSITS